LLKIKFIWIFKIWSFFVQITPALSQSPLWYCYLYLAIYLDLYIKKLLFKCGLNFVQQPCFNNWLDLIFSDFSCQFCPLYKEIIKQVQIIKLFSYMWKETLLREVEKKNFFFQFFLHDTNSFSKKEKHYFLMWQERSCLKYYCLHFTLFILFFHFLFFHLTLFLLFFLTV
jgi:hypothetical protein